ncbi:MAG TPA: HYR domain-containing protein [Blastocatellia bacterium]|nr:HYR domain-containing protein [Blastocatellia bacterium]
MRRPIPDSHGNHSANGSSSQPAARSSASLLRFALIALVVFLGLGGGLLQSTRATGDPVAQSTAKSYKPTQQEVKPFPPLSFRDVARHEALNPEPASSEIKSIDPPKDRPDVRHGVPINGKTPLQPNAPPSFGTGISPGPTRTFKAEFLNGTTIPPDTMGAVGTTHIVTVSNDRMRIQNRDGVEISRMTISSFWNGVTIKGQAIAAFDTKVLFDRFNNRFILISSGNGTSVNSGAMFAVSATADPTGTWYRWSVVADPASTGAPGGSGNWIDYPSLGHNKNWIVIDENVFHYTCNTTTCSNASYWGQQIYVLDKQAAYSNTLSTINLFADPFTNCVSPFDGALGCGFTMAPAITEDNTTDTEYLVEDWDSTAGQLRLTKITGTPSAPVLTVGTQFPQSSESWRFDAARIGTANNCGGTCSGGYIPQRQQSANLPSGSRIAGNDSRIQNSVLRNGKLWTVHHVMVAAASQPAGTTIGGSGNPVDNHTAIQWWQIDPTNETAASTPPLQRGRIHDPTANNCHNGLGGNSAVAPCNGTTSAQFGTFLAFPNISVNQNEDVLIGFSQFSPLTYPSAAYAIRRAADSPNTTRDIVVFRPGQSNYNIGSGSGTARNDRWGDYSMAQTDPLNDIDFWTVQEYAGTNRNDFLAPSYAGPWETWWALINPGGTMPSPSGSLIISEFRLRGPQGVRDEFVELYNPSNVPFIVQTTDNSDGFALVYSTNGTTFSQIFAVIPNGTVIKPHGHFLVTDNPDNTAGGTSALTYSLNGYPSTQVRGADSDFGWSLDLADNGGIALFNTATQANMAAGTRLDSVGFSSIAAGLFKEGNGIPAITAATPTGQMTFFRDLSSGTPKDTGANENDFIFANSVVGETLGSTPRLGAAGPENLGSPINAPGTATMATALLDTGVGSGSAPNRVRDNTVVTNGAFGTLTFRRTFTNNTGLDLPRLRFRVVDLTTNPPSGPAADLRVLTASATVVSLSGGGTANVDGTTLETPPTQAAGGGFNGTLTLPSVTLSTPLTAGSTINLQFTVGVQVKGNFNFCLMPESEPPVSLGPLCFTGTTENTPPMITGGSLSLNAGSSATGTTIATVSDGGQDSAGSLTVTATSVPSGITIGNITNTTGTITADVSADCSLSTNAYNVTLQVTDSEMATNTATFTVNVTATPAPTTPTISADTNGTGTQDQACPEVPLTLHANGATGATSYQWYKDIDLLPGETNSTYQATGAATYYVTATNACGTSSQSAGYVVQNPTPHSPFISFRGQDSSVTTLAICQGSSQIIDSDSATGIQWWKDGAPIPGANSQSYTATQAGIYTAQLNALGCHSQFGRNVTITVDAMPPTPTITGDTNGTGTQDQACPEQPLTLHANGATGATSYTWYSDNAVIPNETTSTLVMTGVGNISVTATNGTCTTPHSATYVVQNPTPHSPFITIRGQSSTTTSITICQGTSVILDSDSATGIQWWKDGSPIPGAGQQSYTVTATALTAGGVYTAQLNALGCHSQFGRNITITVTPTPATPTINAGGKTTFCQGGSVTLTSSSATGNQWYLNNNSIGGATGNTYNATASGSYTVVVTTNGCSSAPSAATTVTATPPPTTATVGGSQNIVPNGTTAPLGGNMPTSGMGTWTVQSGGTGNFNPNAMTPNATFTHTGGAGPIILRWTISNPPCPDSFAQVTVSVGVPPTINCPASPIIVNATTDQCQAVVNFNVTATGAPTPTVNCTPASGSVFPVGTTTVSCSASNGVSPNATCSFAVQVKDTQPPAFTQCPAAVNLVAPISCPLNNSLVYNYTPPAATDNCPGVTVACSPPSGSVFALGTTTVSCTATDAGGNTANCSFAVSVWSGCLQDQTNAGNVCLFNAQTGQYQFCCNGEVIATGTGTALVRGCVVSISHTKSNRRLQMTVDIAAKRGSATVQIGTKTVCTITDQNITNNSCQCPVTASP